ANARAHGEIGGLSVLPIGADIADVREGEGDDLSGVGGVGQDLLVAGHGSVEAHLTDGRASGAEAVTGNHRAVRQHESPSQRNFDPGFGSIDSHVKSPPKCQPNRAREGGTRATLSPLAWTPAYAGMTPCY